MGLFLLKELHFIYEICKKMLAIPEKLLQEEYNTIVVKRGEVCIVVKSLPVTWKIIYLHRICYSLHALECGRSSSKILYLQVMCCAWTSFKNLLPYWNYFTVCGPEFHYWYNSKVVAIWACYGHAWSELHCFLCSCQYVAYRNKKDRAFMVYRQVLLLIHETC